MKASLVLKMGQNLTMTPQLQQAIRLLQMSTLDLQAEIQDALDSNPMLEREEEGETDSSVTDISDDGHEYNANTQQNASQEPSNSADAGLLSSILTLRHASRSTHIMRVLSVALTTVQTTPLCAPSYKKHAGLLKVCKAAMKH